MRRKIIIVLAIVWVACLLGGAIAGRLQQYFQTKLTPPGKREIQHLAELYEARLYDEALSECDQADHDPQCADYKAQIMYVRWATNRKLGREKETERLQGDFLRDFPTNNLGADMYFATAMNLLADADYSGAARDLQTIVSRYPDSAIAPKAFDIIAQLHRPSTAPATQKEPF